MGGRATGRLLADLVAASPRRRRAASEVSPYAEELAELAVVHRVPGPCEATMRDLGLRVPDMLGNTQLMQAMQRVTALHDLAFMDDLFGREGIDFLVFKGQVLTTLVSGDEWERPTSDLDVLVRPADLERAVAVLERSGAVHLDRNWEMMHDVVIGELHLVLPAGTSLDLHWHLLVRESGRASITPDHPSLFEQARHVDLDGAAVATFGKAHTLVYSCFHAVISGGHRLVWLTDIEQLIIRDRPDHDEVVACAAAWKCELMVGAMLMRTRSELGVDGVDSLIERLVPNRAVRGLFAMTDRAIPVSAMNGEAALLRLLTRSLRATMVESTQSLVRRTFGNAWRAVRRQPTPSAVELFEDRPGDGCRERYFASVAAR